MGSRARPSPTVILYPFTIYHSAAKITRRHTVYTYSATERNKWQSLLLSAIEVRRSQEDPKTLYAPQTLNDHFFRIPPRIILNRETLYTGPISCAALFSLQGEGYIAVGCSSGIYVSRYITEYSFRKVLDFDGPVSMVAIPAFNKFIVHCESALFSYPLDLVVRVSQGDATSKDLDSSVEWLSRGDGPISFLKVGRGHDRTVARIVEVKVHVLELTRPDANIGSPAIYQPLGSPVTIPEDPYDASFFRDKIAICASTAIYIMDLINTPDSSPITVPDFPNSKRDAKSLQFVHKNKGATPKIFELAGNANILGMVTCENDNDILLVYDAFGCFVAKDGKPARSSYHIEWERRATAPARRGPHLLLFSPGYLEVRDIETGKLVQIKETNEIRLLRSGLMGAGVLIAAMRGGTDNDGGRTERLVEILYYGGDARVDDTRGVTVS
ncbi:CNH domain-containing protein [Russula dissimulans]|nr:CNH domain-containing protein [Russula dissimulans]